MAPVNDQHQMQDHYGPEKEFLLAVSDELALVQEKKHLVNIVTQRLKSFLGFSYSTIFLVNDDVTYISDFLFAGNDAHGWPFLKEIKLGRVPLDDRILRGEVPDTGAKVLDLDELAETRETLPYLDPTAAGNFREVILFNLKRGPEVIGNWIMGFAPNADIKRPEISFLQLLANMINSAVLNILAHEQLVSARKEYDIIQSISADLSATKERTDLLRIIHQKLKNLFDFSHHFVSIINEDDLTVTSFLRDSESRTKNHSSYNAVNVTKYPLSDGFFNKAVLSNAPVVFDLTQIRSRGNLPYYLEINYESGIRTIVMTVLKVNDKTIGVWSICQIDGQQMSPRQLELIRRLSVQFSIAAANIRSADLIAARELEQTRLLQLSYDLTSVRYQKDLLSVIRNHLKNLVDYNDLQLMLIGTGHTYSCYLQHAAQETFAASVYEGEFSTGDICFNTVMNAGGTVLLETDQLIGKQNCPPFVPEEVNRGIREKIGVALYDGQRKIGLLFFNFKQPADSSDHTMQLIQGIAYQISSALVNILSYEKIIKRENERDTLISLSRHIAAVRNSRELLEVITTNMRSVIGFRHMFIARINDDGNTATSYLLDPEAAARDHPSYSRSAGGKHPLNDGFLDRTIASEEPVVANLDKAAAVKPLPLYLQVNHESGIRQIVTSRLYTNDRPFGLWMVLFDHTEDLPEELIRIIAGIASQLSIAIQNILANTNTEQKGEEKSLLIDFTNSIASVREKAGLSAMIGKELVQLFRLDNYLFLLTGTDGCTWLPYIYSERSSWVAAVRDKGLLDEPLRLPDGMMEKLAESNEPVVLTAADLEQAPHGILQELVHNTDEQHQLMLSPVRQGSQLIGLLLISTVNTGEIFSQLEFYNNICTQMAIVISGITAKEKISRQLEEISGYKLRLEEEKVYLQEELETTNNYADIVGESPEMKKIFSLVNKVAASDSTVMILGETGTGKELIARAIHHNSPRRNKLMVKVNCATLPANLIESELFGHERGSFTGAMERRLGKFELANNGTLFLDEIGEMPLELQVKLLRALQEKEIERIGGKATIKVDVRIIAATNRDLEKEMAEGRFRSDLYYRLNIFPISLPPLRERPNDIPLLATHFIRRFAKKMGKDINMLSRRLLQELKLYHWPGNIRELEHLIERSVLLSSGDTLKNIAIPVARSSSADESIFIYKTIDQNERDHILQTLKACDGRINGKAGAAHVLGVPPSTLSSKMKRLGIKRDNFNSN